MVRSQGLMNVSNYSTNELSPSHAPTIPFQQLGTTIRVIADFSKETVC
jgi:hypothetical protein